MPSLAPSPIPQPASSCTATTGISIPTHTKEGNMMEGREKEIARSVSSRARPMDAQCANCGMSWGKHLGALCQNEKTLFSALLPIESKSSDGWVEWKGTEIPVDDQTLVEVRFNCGEFRVCKARALSWRSSSYSHNICAYRILQEPAKEEPTPEQKFDEAVARASKALIDSANAAMISRDGPAIIREPKPTPAPISNVKPSALGLTIVADRGHRFGSEG